jgi:long-subunit acyl-CoA synthetase (AMP-forming)
MCRFDAFTRAAEGFQRFTRERVKSADPGRVMSYLPLAHSMERSCIEGATLVDGNMRVYFAESLDTFVQDLQRARPTLFLSVPRLWLKFQQGVFAKMAPSQLDRLLSIPIVGGIVRRKVLKGLGLDSVIAAFSGSAPLPPELISWYRRLGLQLLEGYGMTEDNSLSHCADERFSEPGCVGVPLPGVMARISPEGEIQIKSPGQFSGYYKQPELTAEAFTEDGFFRTGDRGELRADGLLKITGRTKELFKTAKGKYVAPAPIENRINAHPMIELSLVSGVGQPAAYAIVLLSETIRPKQKDPGVRSEVTAELTKLLRDVNAAVADYEQLKMIVVAREPWSIENGCLTPTMKIKRAKIEKMLEPEVERWYSDKQKVLWQ